MLVKSLVTAGLVASVCVLLLGSRRGQQSVSLSTIYNPFKDCQEVDDDLVYDADSCGAYDSIQCHDNCVGDCTVLCNDACTEAGGAICSLEKMGNLTAICRDWGLCDSIQAADYHKELPKKLSAVPLPGQITSAPTTVTGAMCDHHALCTYCRPSAECRALVHAGAIVSAGDAMTLLTDLVTTCRSYGCDPLAI